jgi:hypothetical protein
MGSDENQKKDFGKFGKVIIRKIKAPVEETEPESFKAFSDTGKVIGGVAIATAIYTNEVKAGATGIPY